MAKKTTSKAKKGPAKKKSQIKAKKVNKPTLTAVQPQKPVNKVHPFAQFMKSRISNHYSSAPMLKFSNHDTYRKKAI